MKIRDRIKELRRVPASHLQPNPKNWRTHPAAQRDALQGLLSEVGYADALLARETNEGGLMLIDGHLRAETTPDQEVPVLVLDVTEDEAAKLLAAVDPLAGMAGVDEVQLDQLLRSVHTGSEALQQMFDRVAQEAGIVPPADGDEDLAVDKYQAKFAVLVKCASEEEQLELLERFEQEGLECKALIV